MEEYFKKYKEAIVGIDQTFHSPYGEKKIVYADWIASGRLYRPIEEKITNQFGPFIGNTHTETRLCMKTEVCALLISQPRHLT